MTLVNTDFFLASAWLLIAGCLLLYYLSSTFLSWFRLRHVPGPSLASISYLWLARAALSRRLYYIYRDLGVKYGSVVRVGPNEVSTDDASAIRKMSAARSTYKRDPWYQGGTLNPHQRTLFTLLDTAEHDRRKARLASGYSGRDIPALEPGIDDQVRALLALIRTKYLSDPATGFTRLADLGRLANLFTMDVISRVGFGEELGHLKTDSDVTGFIHDVKKNWPTMAITLDVPWIRNLVYSPVMLKLFGPKVTDKSGMGKLMRIGHDIVHKRFDAIAAEEKDMMASFIHHGVTLEECENEVLLMLVAGSETTASVIRVTMLCLMSSPRVYKKLKAEIKRAVSAGEVSSPIQLDEARRIPYLQAVIYEGLRMRPPAPGLYAKQVPTGGDTLGGVFLPAGTAVGMNTSALLRSTTLFGEDADVFRPERFEQAKDADTRTEMERAVELIFGYGRWMCAGKPVAFMELNKVFFELLRAFDFQPSNPAKPWHSDSFHVFVEENMWVIVTESDVE